LLIENLIENSAIKEMQPNRDYYILVARQSHTYPPAFRWQIMRRGNPMGVRIEGDGFPSYDAARLARRWRISLSSLSERRIRAIDPSWSVGVRPRGAFVRRGRDKCGLAA
jgi:hypothetical protein